MPGAHGMVAAQLHSNIDIFRGGNAFLQLSLIHICAGTYDALLGSDLHGTELPQVGGDGLPQGPGALGRRGPQQAGTLLRMVWRMSRAQTVKGKSSAAMELVARSRNQTGCYCARHSREYLYQ